MKSQSHKKLNAKLAAEFLRYSLAHPRWVDAHVPHRAIVVFETDDAEFNRWAWDTALQARSTEKPRRPMVLLRVHAAKSGRSTRFSARAAPKRTKRPA